MEIDGFDPLDFGFDEEEMIAMAEEEEMSHFDKQAELEAETAAAEFEAMFSNPATSRKATQATLATPLDVPAPAHSATQGSVEWEEPAAMKAPRREQHRPVDRLTRGVPRGLGSAGVSGLDGSNQVVFATRRTALPKRVDCGECCLSRPPEEGECFSFTTGSGDRKYFRVKEPGSSPQSSPCLPPAITSGSLLDAPIEELLAQVREAQVQEAVRANEAANHPVPMDETYGGDDGGTAETKSGEELASPESVKGHSCQLWVDKYAPRNFTELLSGEKINREVLRAIKSWDPFVFGREAPPPPAYRGYNKEGGQGKQFSSQVKGKGSNKGTGSAWGKGKGSDAGKGAHQKALDLKSPKAFGKSGSFGSPTLGVKGKKKKVDNRPESRIIMLCGPPGLGKTTLANIVAAHAGYRPLEINASDDRSADVLKEKITMAMEHRSLFGDKKPNCIILDEVDGTEGKAAIKVITDIVTAPLHPPVSAEAKKKGSKSRRSSSHALTRPLILICNDQFKASLRPIREIAQVFTFRKASLQRLVSRLVSICKRESVAVGPQSLHALAEGAGNDVRSCLNTLQFVAQKGQGNSSKGATEVALIAALGAGLKDEKVDLFDLWRAVYHRGQPADNSANKAARTGSAVGVMRAMEKFDDNTKVLGGLHESFLQVRFSDPTLAKTSKACDWFAFADTMDSLVHRTQDFVFRKFIPVAAAGLHVMCRVDTRPAISAPKQGYEAHMMRQRNSNILQSFSDGLDLSLQRPTQEVLVMDFITPVLNLLAPPLRPMNLELFNEHERATFDELVANMMACGLSYAKAEASLTLQLEPAIDQLARYQGCCFNHREMAAPLRPMIAHEIKFAAIRKKGAEVEDLGEGQKRGLEETSKTSEELARDELSKRARTDARLSASVPFWDKCSEGLGAKKSLAQTAASRRNQAPLRYRFKSGYTNAVRRSAKMSELM